MNVIKRHKGLAIIGGLSLILLIILFAIFARMLFSTGKGEYGDRLKGIPEIADSKLKEVSTQISDNEAVDKANVRVQGKIVYTIIYVKGGTNKDIAKDIATKTIANYSEEVINAYDFEFLIHEDLEVAPDAEDTSYTLAGTKHPDSEVISWTK